MVSGCAEERRKLENPSLARSNNRGGNKRCPEVSSRADTKRVERSAPHAQITPGRSSCQRAVATSLAGKHALPTTRQRQHCGADDDRGNDGNVTITDAGGSISTTTRRRRRAPREGETSPAGLGPGLPRSESPQWRLSGRGGGGPPGPAVTSPSGTRACAPRHVGANWPSR